MRALRIALVVVAVGEVALSWSAAVDHFLDKDLGGLAAFATAIVLGGQAAGWAIGRTADRRHIGILVQAVSLAAPLGLTRGYEPLLFAAWLATVTWPAGLLLTAPPQRRPLAARVLGIVSIVALPIVTLVAAVTARSSVAWSWWGGANAFFSGSLLVVIRAGYALAFVVIALAAVDTVVTFRRSPPGSRRLIRPVAYPGMIWAAATAVLLLYALRDDRAFSATNTVLATSAVQLLATAAMLGGATWVLAVLPRVERASGDAGAILSPDGLTRYLRRALADPSARLVFSEDDGTRWFDADGTPAVLGFDDVERTITVMEHDGTVLGAIECDVSLASQPQTIEIVATAAALSMDANRYVAIAKSEAELARQLAARLVATADTARADVRGTLTAGPLADLRSIEARIAAGDDAASVAAALKAVAEHVRLISHGLIPSALEHGGLAGALTIAAVVPHRRFPSAIEVTAFIAAHDDLGAEVVDEDHQLVIRLHDETTDLALRDRVAVLGGVVDGATITLPLGSSVR